VDGHPKGHKNVPPLPTKKKSTDKPPLLHPLPNPERPNIRIHADLFSPMLAAGHQHKYILCITDAFSKYALVTAVENKEAETVTKAIFNEWFCKFGIPAQIHTDGGKEFVNKLSNELFQLLNVQHTKTTPAHPQCNAQVEVFNKTVKKYLASFVDDTTLDWENFLPPLMLSYNTSYHSTIASTLFELLFGEKPRLLSFPNPDIQRLHYGKSTAAEHYQLLQKLRFWAKNIASDNSAKIKDNFDKTAFPHNFNINDLVWFEDFAPLGKNPKLTPKWQGPAKITEINDTNARLQLPKGKTKIYNIMRLKKFFVPTNEKPNSDTDAQQSEFKQSMCARCKLQFGEHLIEQNTQNAANLISAANDPLQNLITKQFFDEATSKDLLKIQQLISDVRNASDNLINAHNDNENLINMQKDSENLINMHKDKQSDEIF
jgi:Integrase core domain